MSSDPTQTGAAAISDTEAAVRGDKQPVHEGNWFLKLATAGHPLLLPPIHRVAGDSSGVGPGVH